MRNEFETRFWQNAYTSLPASVRARYATQLRAAEQWELRLDAVLEAWTRTKQLFTRPAAAH